MNAKERYFWDLTGYIILRQVLAPKDLKAANAAVDASQDDDPMGTVIQPGLKAGDVFFFMDGAQGHGTFPWQNDHERRSILFKYAGRTSARSGPASELAPPETCWDEATIDGMAEEERAVMWGPYSNHRGELPFLDIDKEGTVRVEQQE